MTSFQTVADDFVLALQSGKERVQIDLENTSVDPAVPVDATRIGLRLTDLAGAVVLEEEWTPPPPVGARIQHPSTGRYFVKLGDVAAETASAPRTLLANWDIEVDVDGDNIVQTIKVITPYVMMLIGKLRRQIDKARKEIIDDPTSTKQCFLGYSDKDLVEYLEGGLSTWNMYEPYPTFCRLEDFPSIYAQGLVEAALLVGVASQNLFAIDSDIPSYSAQGAAFVIQHQTPLAQHLNFLAQRLDKLIPIAKLKLVRSGSVHTEIAPNARLQTLVNMAPSGAIFRNFFVRS